jgi:Tropinone reductase 1
MTADISHRDGRQQVIDAVAAEWGGSDILVNNVGTNIRKPWIEMSGEEFAAISATNLQAPMELCRALFPLLQKGIVQRW